MRPESLEYQLSVAESEGMIERSSQVIRALPEKNTNLGGELTLGRPAFINEDHEQGRATGEGMPEAPSSTR